MDEKLDKNVEVQILKYEERASRLELFVRMFYIIPVIVIWLLYAFVANICLSFQLFVILLLGRRSKTLNSPIEGFGRYCVQLLGYFMYLTDERPGISPKKIRFFKIQEKY